MTGLRGLDGDIGGSASRISPTMMTSGSYRMNARSATAKFSPAFSRTLT